MVGVLGVLGVVAVLSVCFITLARLERKASQQRLNGTRALLLARSGIEDALARMDAGQDALAWINRFGGEDLDLSGALDAFERQQEVFRTGILDVDSCPSRAALRPAFPAVSGALPRYRPVDGRQRGWSGTPERGTLPRSSWSLKVSGEEGIHVNGGDLTSAGLHVGTYDQTLSRILGNLAEELGALRTDGTNLVSLRPAGGWTSLDHAALILGWTPSRKEQFRPCLAFRAWVDRKVIRTNIDPNWALPERPRPDAWPAPAGSASVASLAEVKTGCQFHALGGLATDWSGKRVFNLRTNSYAPDFERDSAQRVVGRAPVNLNWARTRPAVLRALLRDLSGVGLSDYQRVHVEHPLSIEKEGNIGILVRTSLNAADVTAVASAIQNHADFPTWAADFPDWDRTASFDSWDEFSRFLDLKLPAQPRDKRDLIRANFDPNSDLNKSNPGETFYRAVDKSDLLAYSTEFSFQTPLKSLSCTGRVLDVQGRLLAERTLSSSACYDQVRLTSQSEFCAADLGGLDVAGDEAGVRLPGDPGFIAQTGGADPTFGSRYPPIPPAVSTKGLSLQTYPEPQWRGGGCPAPAAYDGHLELATLETPHSEPGLTFLAGFDYGYDASYAAGSPACGLDACHSSSSVSVLGDAAAVPGSPQRLGMLYPDGCYAESRRCPGYQAPANLGDGLQGIASFWYKPSFDGAFTNTGTYRRPHLLYMNLYDIDPTPLAPYQGANRMTLFNHTQNWCMALSRFYSGDGGNGYGCLFEHNVISGDDNSEDGSIYQTPNTLLFPHRWHLVTMQWNLLATTKANYSNLNINGSPKTGQYNYTHPGGVLNGASLNPLLIKLTRNAFRADGSFGTPSFYLGYRRGVPPEVNGYPDGTYDELAFLTRGVSMADSNVLASTRYAQGRYAKHDEALDPAQSEYLSCPIRVEPGSRLVRLDWTLRLPRILTPVAGGPADQWLNPNRMFYGDGNTLTQGSTSDAALSLLNASGSLLLPSRMTRPGSLSLNIPAGGLKVGINLRPRLDDNLFAWARTQMPLLESPVFDDITFTVTPRGGPRTLVWREGE